ncbi:Transmembrane protein [Ceratobasidium theobromae]|uniref:Transmembrane protein n=1 Tax=Ceratobasidium theobromae TaxID=1582974 RepID=A0A5N5QS43_9AGAM|nr:Transmembrane protein [Ceratobasidium theobromae]
MLSNVRLLAAVASTTSTSDSPTSTSNPAIPIPIPPTDLKRCRLLGPTALIVQGLMGILVILSLIWKRNHESPRRPWRIWIFDVSKQVVGQIFVHFSNVFISALVAYHIGVALIYAFLHAATWLLTTKLRWKGFRSGDYGGVPPSKVYWMRQATVYVTALLLMKLAVVLLFAVWPGLYRFGDWLLGWTDGDAAIQVVFVMGLFPIVMNILQFWLIDSIVKLKEKSPALPISTISIREEHDHLVGSGQSESDDESATPTRRLREGSPPPSPSPVPTPPGTGYGAMEGKGKAKRRGDLPDVSDWTWEEEERKGSVSSRSAGGPTSISPRPRPNATSSETWFMTSNVKRAHTPDFDLT